MAEVRLLSAIVMRPAIVALADTISHKTGYRLTTAYDSARLVERRIRAGELWDAAISQRRVLDALATDGLIAASSVVTLARSGVALAVRAGAPRPGIGSADALRRALLAARSVAYPDPVAGHASGVEFLKILDRLGIRREIDAKTKIMEGALFDFVDEVEIAITQPMEILAAPGYELVGLLPAELQDAETFTWAAGIVAASSNRGAAGSFVRFLTSEPAAAVIAAKGMTPVRG